LLSSRPMHTVDDPSLRTKTLTWHDPLPSLGEAASLSGLEYMRKLVAGELPPPPIAVLLGMSVAEVDEGRAVFEAEPGEHHYNPIGSVHGGFAATLLDSALGCAVHTTLPAGVGYTTLDLQVRYARGITVDTGTVRCEARVLHSGRRSAIAEAELTAVATGKLLAHGTTTCAILG